MKKNIKKNIKKWGVILGLLVCSIVQAEETQVTAECRYKTLEGLKGTALFNALHDAIATHTTLTYTAVRADKAKVDLRDNGTVWDMYSNCSFDKTDYCGTGTDYEACDCHNREHMLPKSFWGGSTTEPMYTDLHHIIPTDFAANTQRSAWIYDEVQTATWTNGVSKKGSSRNFNKETAFEPADEYKGDVARTYFYMITCYKDKNFTQGGKGYKYFQSGTATLNSTALNLLLKWHRNDPVSQKEKNRNDKAAALQGNRNPFVDDPNLVEYIWGTKKNQNYSCSATAVEEAQIHLDDSDCRVFNIMGQEVTDHKDHLPQGIYILYKGGQSTTILLP